jgi:hypothetical protein
MAYPKQQIPRMEKERFVILDSRQSYAYFTCSDTMYTDFSPDSEAGAGKSVLWYGGSII